MAKKHRSTSENNGVRTTPLHRLKRNKNVVGSPFSQLGKLALSSWVNEVLADRLWSVLIAGAFTRERSLHVFRTILTSYKDNISSVAPIMLTHSQLAALSDDQFDQLFRQISEDEEIRECLSTILLFETIPDRHHWERLIDNKPDWKSKGLALVSAVASCFDHQSEAATSCRWVRVMTLVAQDKMKIAEHLEEMLLEIVEFPNRGDLRKVRPSIRAPEMATRNLEFTKGMPAPWAEAFWSECWKHSRCIPSHRDESIERVDYRSLFDQLREIHDLLTQHFMTSTSTTAVDPRHDGAFGLVFYVISILFFSLKASTGQTFMSRISSRSALEAYVTLSYLTTKDDFTIWLQFRNYGSGQSKLAYLKNVEKSDLPSFLTLDMLESIANEDMWMEFQDIKLGAWADKNLRKMAEESGTKDIYDRYYDALSGYVHGNWMAIRHTVFGECLNPLHRFHRLPLPPREFGEDAVPDLVKMANLCLERLAFLYPPFRPRFRASDPKNDAAQQAL